MCFFRQEPAYAMRIIDWSSDVCSSDLNINPADDVPSMFEPTHGSAFDIVGKGIANPIGAIWTGAMMLDHLGEGRAATRLMAAIEKVTENGPRTPDLGGQAASADVTRAVLAALEG